VTVITDQREVDHLHRLHISRAALVAMAMHDYPVHPEERDWEQALVLAEVPSLARAHLRAVARGEIVERLGYCGE
jgi:hypothetical protein